MGWIFRWCGWGVLLCALQAMGQAVVVRGTVSDRAGAPVAGVGVRLEGADKATVREAQTSMAGEFRFEGLAAGEYVLRVQAANGLAGRELAVHALKAVNGVKLVLAPASVEQVVEVDAGTTVSADAADNQDVIALTGDSLQHLPVFDQDYVGTLSAFLDPAATSTSGVSLVVDGVEVQTLPVTASGIADVKMNTDPYSAEFASSGRGRLEITTKPGGSQFHGQMNFLARDSVFNGKNYFAAAKPPEQRFIYEGNLTGPVGHGGHTTFLVTAARRNQDVEAAVYAVTPQGLAQQNVPTPNTSEQMTGRVTHDFSANHRLAVGYNFEYTTMQNAGVGGLVLAEAGYNTEDRTDNLIVNDRWIVSPSLIHQFQMVLEKEEVVTTSVTQAQAIQVEDSFTGGGAQADLARTENTVHLIDIVSWTQGRHYVRFGATIPQISRRALDDRANRLGTFGFTSLSAYEAGTPSVFTVQTGAGRGLYWINEMGAFVQDEIALRKNLHVTAGVRYQWQTYLSDLDCFAPRLSVAYMATKKWVVRGGAGIFYDRTGGDYPATFKLHNGVVEQQYRVINPGYPNPLPAGQSFTGPPVSLVQEAANLRAPYSIQYSVTAERALTKHLAASVGYRGITGVASFRSRDANAPLPPAYVTPPDPAVGFVQQVESAGRSRTNAMDVMVHGRAGQWFEGNAQYTLSETENNTGGINWFPQNQYEPNDEWGRSDTDRRHRFNMIGTVHPGHWLSLGIAVALATGAPYTQLAGTDAYNTGLNNARLPGVGRNTLQGAGIEDVDLQWDHDFHLNKAKGEKAKLLNVGVSAFDALNHPKFMNYVGNVQSALYGQPTAALQARELQFSLRYQF